MSSPIKQKLLCVSLILSTCFLLGCGGSDREKAKKLVAEGDALVDSGNKLSQEGHHKLREYMGEAKMASFPSNRDQIRGVAQEAADLFGKSVAAYRDAASKYEEVGKIDMKVAAKEFMSLKAQSIRKRADAVEAVKEIALLPLDSSINDVSTLRSKVMETDKRGNALQKESDDFDARAKKVMADNP